MRVPKPKRWQQALISWLLISAFACSKSKDKKVSPAESSHASSMTDLYGLSKVPTFELTLPEEAMESLRESPREWVRGDFAYEEEAHGDIRIRIKGHRSLRSVDNKPSLKLRFDKGKEHKGRRFLGVRRLTLNNLVEDPTMIREYLGYRLAREVGLPVPKAGFAQIRLNGQPYGLYLVLETPDEDFLARQFGSGEGELYEGEYGCDLFVDDVEGYDLDVGNKDNRAPLMRFAEAAAGSGGELWQGPDAPVTLEHLTSFLAFATYVGDFDGYHHSHNYRIYRHPETNKWHLMAWGLDRSFFKELDPYSSRGLLAKRCFAQPECRIQYLLALRRIDQAAKKLDLVTGSKVISGVIADAVNQDTKRPYKAKRINKLRDRLREFLEKRTSDIAGYTACLDEQGRELDPDKDGYGCMDCNNSDPAVHPGAEEICDGVDNDCSGLADDSASCPCPIETIGESRYAFCNLPMPWNEADAHCRSLGGRLASAGTSEQSAAIFEHAQAAVDDRWWLGGGDRETEGVFKWRDGSALADDMWAKGQPDNEACNQDCVALRKGGGGSLNDTHCGQHRPFVCQLP
jgi:hypothetical protein